MRFYLIYGIYLANKYPQTCRDRRLDGPNHAKKFDVIYGGYLFSVVGVDVPDDPKQYEEI